MSLFNFNMEEMLTFIAVLLRYSVLFSVLPFIGDRMIPAPVKVLLGLSVTITLFPPLVRSGLIRPSEARIWGESASGIMGIGILEVLFGLTLGFCGKMIFDGISFGANLVGNFMGYASASFYDPHQESQTEVIAQVQTTVAMLIFLALDGHHLMLRAAIESYKIVGLGKVTFGSVFSQRLISMSGEVFRFAIQLAAPVAVSIFSVNIVFGILSKALPQLNIFMLSAAATALIGLIVMSLTVSEFQGQVSYTLSKIEDWQIGMMKALALGR